MPTLNEPPLAYSPKFEKGCSGAKLTQRVCQVADNAKAYKDIERVMEQQSDLVEIVAELKQVVCVKG